MPTVEDVLGSPLGMVVAPAGCGKTHLIVDSLKVATGYPSLVLTHTIAGVAALRHRLKIANVPNNHYRLNTIAGWALTIISMFPERAEYHHNPTNAPAYTDLQNAVGRLCQSGAIDEEIKASYSRLLVDEYQDCSESQHQIVTGLARSLPTIIFGDPLQAIFNFGNNRLPDWHNVVANVFPAIGELNTPWRWNNVGAQDLGAWLLRARNHLLQNQTVDLTSAPRYIFWIQLTNNYNADVMSQIQAQNHITRTYPNDTLLIIGNSRNVDARHNYAIRSPGVGVVERVDFPDVVTSANEMVGGTGPQLLDGCINFLVKVMTNVYGDQVRQRIQSILGRRNRNDPTPQELTAIALHEGGGYEQAIAFMDSMKSDRNRRVYRHSAYNIMVEALKLSIIDPSIPLNEVVAKLREQRRHAGRKIPFKAVGSTLLLKGLEADHVLILDADNPNDRMTAQHLYVALSRGAKSVTVFSRNNILP